MLQQPIQLIVGLGNPGAEYANTRHNAGTWFVEKVLQEHTQALLNYEKKFHGFSCKAKIFNQECHFLIPTTYMNESGQAVVAVAKFFKIPPQAILIAHDDLDLPLGIAKLKKEGGHGGHNGLRSIIAHLGSSDFVRIRIGIEHPKDNNQKEVKDYVLSPAKKAEKKLIDAAIDHVIQVLPNILEGDIDKAMQHLHTQGS